MKKRHIRIYLFLLFIFLCFKIGAAQINVNFNDMSMKYEIFHDNKLVKELSALRFKGFQIVGQTVFFIDCSQSRIQDYGVLCYLDINQEKIIYTTIETAGHIA